MKRFRSRLQSPSFSFSWLIVRRSHCGKSLKAKNCSNCVRVQMHRTAKCHVYAKKRKKKRNAAITWCGAQSFVCVCVRARTCECVYVRVLACAMHFKEFLMTVKKWKGPAVKYKDRYWGREVFLLAITKRTESLAICQKAGVAVGRPLKEA